MIKINEFAFLTFFGLLICSCNGQVNTNNICYKKFKEAKKLVYNSTNEIRQSALDSALSLANESMDCDSIKKAVIDFKVTLLISMKKYSEGMHFVDSLKEDDFIYSYKKNLINKNIKALYYSSKGDSSQRNLTYKEMAGDLERYLKEHNIKGKEFEEIFLDLYSVKGNFLNANQINYEVDSLEKKYPEKKSFFEFLKK